MLEHDQIKAGITVSHWDDALDEWRQIDPPPDADAKRADERHVRDAEAEETRTLAASAGNLVRASFDQSLLAYAQKLGLECKIVEHHHLLTTQVALTVTGPKRKVDEFAQGLKAESVATIRPEGLLALSPL